MIYELNDTSKVKSLFDGWEETLIYSCLQKVMGKIFVTDGVKTTIKKEEFNYGMTMPKFETIFQDEGDVEILCTMLGAPREDNKWAQFDNDVDIIDQCMFTDLRVVEE